MNPGMLLQIIMIVTGFLLFLITVISLAKRKMTESFCLAWGIVAIIVILAGILLRPAGWNQYISGTGLVLLLLIGFCFVYAAYFMSSRISELMRKNNEMAIQLSLLKQEKEELSKRLDELSEKMK